MSAVHPYGYGSVATALFGGFAQLYADSVLPERRWPRRVINHEPNVPVHVTIDPNHPTNNPREVDEGGHRPSCTGMDPEQFFPGHRWGHDEKVARTVAVCRYCPMRAPCLDWALAHHEHGIWGGTTEADRRHAQADPRWRR